MSALCVTAGEPAGIGPDLVIKHAQLDHGIPYVVIADIQLLQERAQKLKLNLKINSYTPGNDIKKHIPGELYVLHTPLHSPCETGKLNPANASYVLKSLDIAMQRCADNEFSALVTGPVNKAVINQAGFSFSGHTEYLAEGLATEKPMMLLATPGLRVALATTHVPLKDVSNYITQELIRERISLLHSELQNKFNIDKPRIKVCGLNPHAGEQGHIGLEDQEVLVPVIQEFQKEGWLIDGPVSADTAFTIDKMQETDAYLTMFHDQGLPVLKHVGFNKAVNITLGLPIIRSSVDHGTALELAGTGQSKLGSFEYALDVALKLSTGCKQHNV